MGEQKTYWNPELKIHKSKEVFVNQNVDIKQSKKQTEK